VMEQVVAGVTGEPALGKNDEIDALPLGSSHEGKRTIGVEGAVRKSEFRGCSCNTKEAVGVHVGSVCQRRANGSPINFFSRSKCSVLRLLFQ
jgi:hypothetical protein